MKLKRAIIEQLDRDTLKAIVDDLELDGVDRRSREEMAAAVSRARRATPDVLLEYLYEDQVKEVCELVGVDPTGRRSKLITRLLRSDGQRRAAKRKTERVTMDETRAGSKKKKAKSQRSQRSPRLEEETAEGAEGRREELEKEPVRLPDPPPGMLRVTRTELVWPGKYNEDGTLREVPRVSLPFQVIERIGESRATREARK